MRKLTNPPDVNTGRAPKQAALHYRILVVDDDAEIRQLSVEALATSGYKVDAAEDAVVAWYALLATEYDLLITDHSMPKVTGIELVRMLRSSEITMPIILATGALPTRLLEGDPWLNLAATILKPFSATQLLETVEKVLRAPQRGRSCSELVPKSAQRLFPTQQVAH